LLRHVCRQANIPDITIGTGALHRLGFYGLDLDSRKHDPSCINKKDLRLQTHEKYRRWFIYMEQKFGRIISTEIKIGKQRHTVNAMHAAKGG